MRRKAGRAEAVVARAAEDSGSTSTLTGRTVPYAGLVWCVGHRNAVFAITSAVAGWQIVSGESVWRPAVGYDLK